MSIACLWETSLSKCTVYGPMKSINVDNENFCNELAQGLHVERASQDIHATNWVIISGTEYRPGLIICTQIEHEMPVFLRIEKIIVVDSIICFFGKRLVVDHFSEHFHSYKVFESDHKDVVKADGLVIYKPFDLQSSYGGDKGQYLVPLFSL